MCVVKMLQKDLQTITCVGEYARAPVSTVREWDAFPAQVSGVRRMRGCTVLGASRQGMALYHRQRCVIAGDFHDTALSPLHA
mgnify:CR=1 FL=1